MKGLIYVSLFFYASAWMQIQYDRINVKAENKIYKVDQLSGATADAQLTNCLANYIAGGGTCDARGFGATIQHWAARVTIGANQTVLFDPATKFQPAGPRINIFLLEPNGVVKGFTFDCASEPSWSGVIFANDTGSTFG